MDDNVYAMLGWAYPLVDIALLVFVASRKVLPGKPWLIAFLVIGVVNAILYNVLNLLPAFDDVLAMPLEIMGFVAYCMLIPFVLAVANFVKINCRSVDGESITGQNGKGTHPLSVALDAKGLNQSNAMTFASVVDRCIRCLSWKNRTWVGKGYLLIVVLTIIPWLFYLLLIAVASALRFITGSGLAFSSIALGGESPPCILFGFDVGPALSNIHAVSSWVLIGSVIVGPSMLFWFTVIAVIALCFRK